MPLDPAQTVAQFESSGCTNNQNPDSSASGCFGFVNATWATWAPKVGVDLSQYPTAASAPTSVQFAVFAADYNAQGFSDWTCNNCDPKFTAALAANGGPTSYTASLSTDPSSYSFLDQSGGRQSYFAGSGGAPGTLSVGSGGSYVSTPSAGVAVSSQTSALDQPFTWAYTQLIGSTQQTMNAEILAMQTMVSAYIGDLFMVALAICAYRAFNPSDGNVPFKTLLNAAVWAVGVIIPAVAKGSVWYLTFVVNPMLQFPVWWQQFFTNTTGITSPAAMFDYVYNATYAQELLIWQSTPTSIRMVEVAFELLGARGLILLSLAALFMVFLMVELLAMVAIILGPVAIPFALFPLTRGIAREWSLTIISFLVSKLAVNVLLGLYAGVMLKLMQSMKVTGTPQTDVPGFWGCAIIMALLGWSAKYVPRLVERIHGGVSVGMERASHHMSGGPARDAAMTPIRMARRYAGV